MKNITINDIARVAGVAPSTVYKALSGNKGVKPDKREQIKQIAEELGYVTKSQSMQRRNKKVAVIFPDPEIEGFAFYELIWKGIRERALELSSLGLSVEEYTFNGTLEDQLVKLNWILENELDICAMATLVWDELKYLAVFEKYSGRNIPIFTIKSDAPSSSRVATIIANSYQTGRLAAEYLGMTIPKTGKVIIAGTMRSSLSHDQVSRGFFDQMAVTNPDIQILELYESKASAAVFTKNFMDILTSVPDIHGIYANNARTTTLIGRLLMHNELKNKLIIVGSEIYKESCYYMNNGVLNALIDEQPYQHGYKAMSIIYNYVMNGKLERQVNYIPINIVLQSNLPT